MWAQMFHVEHCYILRGGHCKMFHMEHCFVFMGYVVVTEMLFLRHCRRGVCVLLCGVYRTCLAQKKRPCFAWSLKRVGRLIDYASRQDCALILKCAKSSGVSAEKPKSSVAITLRAYLYHNPLTPASIATLFWQLSGNTCALYSAS